MLEAAIVAGGEALARGLIRLPVIEPIMARHGGGIEIGTEGGCGTTTPLWLDAKARMEGVAA